MEWEVGTIGSVSWYAARLRGDIMAKMSRAQAAARGTKRDAGRTVDAAVVAAGPSRNLHARPQSTYEARTAKIFTVVQVLLVAVPVAMLGYVWLAGGGSVDGLRDAMEQNPTITVSFISAMCQPLVAWLLKFVRDHYQAGDGGYAAGNLIALICGELMLQNAVGVLGCALLLWRIWKKIPGELAAWKEDRGLGGMAADLSGAVVVCVVGALCAFATWRIGLA